MQRNQERAPLLEALQDYVTRVRAPFHIPGHKMGRAAAPEFRSLLGGDGLAIDLTEAPGLDDLHAPEGPIREAQQLAADLFGAAHTFFLVGGTTAGLHGLVLAACRPGESLAVPRNAHRSVLGAMILAGVRPVWMRVQFHEELDVATHLDPQSMDVALAQAAAAVLINPTYYGMVGRLGAEIECIHSYSLPVLVDEAHGTHFAVHHALPASALSLGADGVVQSTHKTGGSMTQSSMCHLGTHGRLQPQRVAEMLRLVQSTSPSYVLLASLDAARRQLALNGREMWDRALEQAHAARRRLAALPGVRVHQTGDPSKILIDVTRRGLTGFQAAEWLWTHGVAVESSGLGYVLAVMTPGDTAETVTTLVEAVSQLPNGPGAPPRPPEPPWPEVVLTPREAYLGAKEAVPLAQAAGRIAAELVAPYPPGIPVVAPGERITQNVIAYLQGAVRAGHHLQGPADPTLHTVQTVRE